MARMHRFVVAGIILAASACGRRGPPAAAPTTAAPAAAPTAAVATAEDPLDDTHAVVSPKLAQFVITIPPRPTWQWNTSAVPENTREYGLVVELLNPSEDGKSYQFGYSHYRAPGSTGGQGTLADLLAVGQLNVWEVKGNGAKVVKWGKVNAEILTDSTVLLVIRDKKTIKEIFETRPHTATVVAAAPGQFERRFPVTIRYVKR